MMIISVDYDDSDDYGDINDNHDDINDDH